MLLKCVRLSLGHPNDTHMKVSTMSPGSKTIPSELACMTCTSCVHPCAQAPVRFELQDGANAAAGGLRVRARNRNAFASTANLLLSWRVLLDGAPLIVGDPAQRDVSGWYPGGSVAIAPQARQLHAFLLCPWIRKPSHGSQLMRCHRCAALGVF